MALPRATAVLGRALAHFQVASRAVVGATEAHRRLQQQLLGWTEDRACRAFSSHRAAGGGGGDDEQERANHARVSGSDRYASGPPSTVSDLTAERGALGRDNSDLAGLSSILAPSPDDASNSEAFGPEPVPPGFVQAMEGVDLEDDDVYSLIAMKNLSTVPGLPPLDELRNVDDSAARRASRRQLEMSKQQEIQKSRFRQVDELGRAYATGRRKTSSARVWLMEGEGRMIVNGTTHDTYFPEIIQRAQLLEPFNVTNNLGDFDVKSSVKGGGRSGQAGALRLGISRALQLFDPELRPALKSEGFLTRDPRAVERKKPGKAKARKSFQWVKR